MIGLDWLIFWHFYLDKWKRSHLNEFKSCLGMYKTSKNLFCPKYLRHIIETLDGWLQCLFLECSYKFYYLGCGLSFSFWLYTWSFVDAFLRFVKCRKLWYTCLHLNPYIKYSIIQFRLYILENNSWICNSLIKEYRHTLQFLCI